MKKLLALPLLLLLTGNAFAASHVVSFDNASYNLAFASESGPEAINEYIPAGQTLDNWTKMVALHIYHNMPGVTPDQFAQKMGQFLKHTNPGANYKIIKSTGRDEVIIDFFTWTTAPPIIAEFNIFKFSRQGPTDLIGYQYAFRNYGPLTPAYTNEFKANRLRLIALVAAAPYPAFAGG